MRHASVLAAGDVLSTADLERLANQAAQRCRGLPVLLLYLHGSYARQTPGALSDLDLAVLMEPAASRQAGRRGEVLLALGEAWERDDVDLVVLNTAGVIIRDRVARSGRLLYATSERQRIEFEAAAIKASLDFQPFSRTYDEALFRQLREGRFLD